ncbi:MAG: UDP-N-acetylmuramate dehydrogenase [Cyclobacteriaceae bacterium]|nr:UDP-N-acetylmuramate dehydrogenase [Cyclobacteriaceae bacterium]
MIKVSENKNLKSLNTFGVSAATRYWIAFDDPDKLVDLLQKAPYKSLPKIIVGSGSNILFARDFPGCIIHPENQEVSILTESDEKVDIEAGAGMEWDKLVVWAVDNGYYGFENLSLIPGSVGAAAIQNIGAYGIEVSSLIQEVQVLDINTGENFVLDKEECKFAYRTSIFKKKENTSWLVLNVRFSLSKIPAFNLTFGNLSKSFEETNDPTLETVRDLIIKTRQSKLPDPVSLGNAGSFFKNPIIPIELLNALKKSYPNIPSYEQPGSLVKLPAAWLIDQCHFKGMKHKGAAVHINQPLVLINHNNASGRDIVELSMKIQQKIKNEFGITLEPEVRII